MSDVSRGRLLALRAVYLLNFLGLGAQAWPALLAPPQPLGLIPGVALSFWAALALLMGLGLRYPLRMLPLLFIQLLYKVLWLAAVALPLWRGDAWGVDAARFSWNFIIPVALDLLVIPWAYVREQYLHAPAERARPATAASNVVG